MCVCVCLCFCLVVLFLWLCFFGTVGIVGSWMFLVSFVLLFYFLG